MHTDMDESQKLNIEWKKLYPKEYHMTLFISKSKNQAKLKYLDIHTEVVKPEIKAKKWWLLSVISLGGQGDWWLGEAQGCVSRV